MGEAVGLLQETQFAAFFGVSLLISIALAFYYSFTSLYLEKRIGVAPDNVGPLMTLGQWVELAVMFTLPWFLQTLGIKWVLAVGMAAWGVRYAIFALEKPFALIVFAIAIHGICFDFFFAAGMIHVSNIAPEAAKASAQALVPDGDLRCRHVLGHRGIRLAQSGPDDQSGRSHDRRCERRDRLA